MRGFLILRENSFTGGLSDFKDDYSFERSPDFKGKNGFQKKTLSFREKLKAFGKSSRFKAI